MFKTFFKSELQYHLRKPITYVYLVIFFFIEFIAIVLNPDAGGRVLRNAPYQLHHQILQLSFFSLFIVFAFVNQTALKDYKNKFDEILFTTPLKRSGYFFGRFFAVVFLATFPAVAGYLGFIIGSWLAPIFGWAGPERFGPFHIETFLGNYFLFILPNAFILSSMMYALAMKWKHSAAALLIIVFFIGMSVLAQVLEVDPTEKTVSGFLDMTGVSAFRNASKYLNITEKHTSVMLYSKQIFWNRLIWISTAAGMLFISYSTFTMRKNKSKKHP
ncbi:ABC transporter permease [Spongiimicrobium salis]|uniref:ABC transporter permease n=1 Tax=Spongiimicrobium salis TaxID=1667022 RepID=UPI00374D1679